MATFPGKSSPPADKPPQPDGAWGAILTATPIVLTVLATIFAGVSSSEMTKSMYFRSLAAQQQSKAGDQWAFFQAKRIRGTSLEMTVELLQSLVEPVPFDPARLETVSRQIIRLLEKPVSGDATTSAAAAAMNTVHARLVKLLADEKNRQSLTFLTGTALPRIEAQLPPKKEVQDSIDAVIQAIGRHRAEAETVGIVRTLSPEEIEEATRRAEQNADAFDKAGEPVAGVIRQVKALLAELVAVVRPFRQAAHSKSPAESPLAQAATLADGLATSFKVAALDFDARRYRQEAFYNRKAAELYEVRVRRSGFESDRHRERSKQFFYSMLCAQAGVTIASLALAKAHRNLLWLLAALAGAAAISLSSYVYFAG